MMQFWKITNKILKLKKPSLEFLRTFQWDDIILYKLQVYYKTQVLKIYILYFSVRNKSSNKFS